MRLSEHEKKLVERLRRNQQSVIRWRWVGLLGACTNLGAGIYAFVLLQRCFPDAGPDVVNVLFIAILFPTTVGLLVIGGGLVMCILSRWNGKPETYLLLKLIDESHDDDA